ncbi:MAG: D-alanine--D-alanine ligase [Verrucomicrobia bacterium]|jgi:D-alanine-D-alanine ligase|nr:D-alanine--D-alanine ligase [Verrucomicrobiota bacterium]
MAETTQLKITVMLGGPSAEREVSLRSGASVAAALRARGHEVLELDPQSPGWTVPAGTDVVFLALHGTYGEDGRVQAELEKQGVLYTGCGPEASRIGFDKALTKQRCVAAGVPTARFLVVESATAPWPEGWRPPVVLKPVCQGSSVGLHFVERVSDWGAALVKALQHDARVLVEEKITGRECTVGILGEQTLPLVEVRPKTGIYDYQTKYSNGTTEYLCPAPFDEATTERARVAALDAFRAIGGRDYARVDVIIQPDGSPVVLEINTLPGMTETSLLPMGAQAMGLTFGDLCQRMVDLALARRAP